MDVVTDQSKAAYILKAAAVQNKQESMGDKIALWLFAYCARIEDTGTASVQSIESSASKML